MNLISVIIPYYKKKNYLKRTLDSVLNQSYSMFEIILIHDDPGNNDYNFLLNLKKKDKRIRLIKNQKNLGAGFSRNKAIKIAKGNYIAFLDADDIWMKTKLRKQINFMKKNNINFCYTSYNQIDKNGKKIKSVKAPKNQKYNDLIKDCKIGLSTVVLNKKIITNKLKFPSLKTKEDLYYWIQLSKKNDLIGYNKVLTNWRKLDNSLSSNSYQKIKDGYKLYSQYLGFNSLKSLYYLFLLSLNFIRKNI